MCITLLKNDSPVKVQSIEEPGIRIAEHAWEVGEKYTLGVDTSRPKLPTRRSPEFIMGQARGHCDGGGAYQA